MDPSLFFPAKGQAYRVEEVKRVCVQCPVVLECKDYRKNTNTTDGVWAGQIYRLGKTNN